MSLPSSTLSVVTRHERADAQLGKRHRGDQRFGRE